jgi:low temperature requirement protein LtrA
VPLRRAEAPQRATFQELFFDLAFVVALFQLSHELLGNLRWGGAFQTLVLLLAVWLVWFATTWLTNQFDEQWPPLQVVVLAALVGSLVMAAALPEAFGRAGLVFAGAYVAIHIGPALFLALALRGGQLQRDIMRPLFWSGVLAVPWIAGALTHDSARAVLWTLAVIVEFTAFAVGFPTPGLGRRQTPLRPVVAEHLAERYRQFLIIALGELILMTTLAVNVSTAADRGTAFLVSIATAVLLWRIYVYRAGELLSTAIAAAAQPARLAERASHAHLVMVAGSVVTAVGAELVITHPRGHSQPAWVAVIFGGPALFLAGRALFEYTVFARLSTDRLIGLLVLAALTPALLHATPLIVALAATTVLISIAVVDTVRTTRHPSETPSPPSEPPQPGSD